ncbi:MAG: cupredoxin domain-containing protein [Acidimicrobiales bacterium]
MRRPSIPESIVALAAVALLGGAAYGLASDEEATVASSGGAGGGEVAGGTSIDIVEFSFSPAELTVAVGDTVTWTNLDGAAHTTTASMPGTISSGDLKTDDTYEYTFEAGGSFEYICAYHPFMTGTITVEG